MIKKFGEYEGIANYIINIKYGKYRKLLKENLAYDYDDLMQEARISILRALKSYNEDKKAQEKTHVTNCIKHRIKTLITRALVNKRTGYKISLEYEDTNMSENNSEVEVMLSNMFLEKNLSSLQKFLLELYKLGYTNKQICAIGSKININSWDLHLLKTEIKRIVNVR